MSQLPPGFVLDGPSNGPVYGPPPKPKDPPAPKTTYRTLSPGEVQSRGLPVGGVYQESSEGNISSVYTPPKPDAGAPSALSPEDKQAVIAEARQKLRLIDTLEERSRNGWFATGFGAQTAANFNGTTAADVAKDVSTVSASGALQRIMEMARTNGGKNPLTPLSNADFQALGQSIANLDPTQSDAQFQRNLQVYRDLYARALEAAGGTQEDQPISAATTSQESQSAAQISPTNPTDGSNNPPPRIPGDGGGQVQAATGATRSEFDADLSSRLDQLLRSGASFSELNQAAMQAGGQPISPREYAEARKFLRANPNYDKLIVNVQRYKPQTTFEQAASAIGSTAPGAYAMNAAQMLSGNTLDNMASDPARARMAMDISSAQSPTASTLGQLTGGVMAGMAGEAGLARLGMAGGIGRGVAADAAAGAANGAGMTDTGNRLAGAATGGLTGGAGSLAGSVAMRGAARAVAPSGGNLADLYASGVRPTFGQRMANANDGKGLAGMVGRAVNATEEGLQSVPIVGSAIRGARQEARDQFQVGAFNESLKEIGETLPKGMGPGTDPHRYAQAAFNRVYDEARSGMRLVADEELANDLGKLAPDISSLGPQAQGKLRAIMANSVNSKVANGTMDGEAYKKAMADLGKHIARHRKSAMADDQGLADVLEGVRDTLDSAARRHSDPEAVQLLDAADAGYAKLVRIEEASARRGGDAGTFSPAQFDSAVQKTSGGVRSKAYLRGDANMQEYAAQGRTLEDRVPNSGTPERLMAGGAVAGGAAVLEPTTLAVLGAIAGVYAPGARKVMQGAMAPGGPKAKAIANRLRKRARLVGAASAASAVSALPGTSPAQ